MSMWLTAKPPRANAQQPRASVMTVTPPATERAPAGAAGAGGYDSRVCSGVRWEPAGLAGAQSAGREGSRREATPQSRSTRPV